jgi:hypothetical protein
MKFISKSSNLLIVLRPGLSAQPITGTPAKPTVSVRFKDGVADVQSDELVELMVAHPGFNSDFISAEGTVADPFAFTRESEPAHSITEVKFGTPVAKITKGGNPQLSPEIMKLVQQMATKMATDMLPGMVESTIKEIVSVNQASKAATTEEENVPEEVKADKPKAAPKAKK